MVLYFTGTGNSRYLARRIAEGLEMLLYDLNACIKAGDTAPVNPVFVLSLLCKSRCLPGNGRLHRLRQVRGAVSPEQRPFEKRKAGLGQKLHPLHGVHLLLSQRGHRVRQKEQRQAPVSR